MPVVAQALASATRIRILLLLSDGEWSMGNLARELGCAPSTLNHHTRLLLEADLVEVESLGATRLLRRRWPNVSFTFDPVDKSEEQNSHPMNGT
jgi:DNA-binding transcriptional ArsR family regulator